MAKAMVRYSRGRVWEGEWEGGVLRFDFATDEGRGIRLFALPEKHVMIIHRPWPEELGPYVEWFVHLVDVSLVDAEKGLWEVTDRQIDVIIEKNLQTYRIIDLEDFGAYVAQGKIGVEDAHQLLVATQRFLDEHLHGGSRFPPTEILPWLDGTPAPRLLHPGDV